MNRFDWIHQRTNGEDFPAEVLLSTFDLGNEHVLQATVKDIFIKQKLKNNYSDIHIQNLLPN